MASNKAVFNLWLAIVGIADMLLILVIALIDLFLKNGERGRKINSGCGFPHTAFLIRYSYDFFHTIQIIGYLANLTKYSSALKFSFRFFLHLQKMCREIGRASCRERV